MYFDAKRKRNSFKLPTSTSSCICVPMENELSNWILEKRNNSACVSGKDIQKKALAIYNRIHSVDIEYQDFQVCPQNRVDFKASLGWLSNFCKRKDFSFRRVSSHGRDLSKNTIQLIIDFFKEISQLIEKNRFTLAQILNMDESACYLDSPSKF